jgi:hypothetical protein
MKIILNTFLKFILIIVFSFLIFFCAFILFNFLPFLKVSGDKIVIKDILSSIVIPSFYHSLFNSFIISVFIYGIFVLNYEKKFISLSFIIPVLFTSLCLFLIIFYFKPVPKNLQYYDIEDARIFFSEKSFFNYEEKIPPVFDKRDFENNIMKNINDKNDRKLMEKNYYFDYKKDKYILKDGLLFDKDRLLTIFYKTGYYEEIKLYFDRVLKNYVSNAIIITGGKINFYDRLNIDFIEDRIFISAPGGTTRYEFMKNGLGEYLNYDSLTSRLFFSNVTDISYKFLYYKNIFKKVLLWLAISFLILSFCIIIFISRYPLISMIFKFIFLVLFYTYFGFLFDVFIKNSDSILPANLVSMKDWIFISLIFISGLILLLLRLVFFRKNSWENPER